MVCVQYYCLRRYVRVTPAHVKCGIYCTLKVIGRHARECTIEKTIHTYNKSTLPITVNLVLVELTDR